MKGTEVILPKIHKKKKKNTTKPTKKLFDFMSDLE